jgi:MFS family permease
MLGSQVTPVAFPLVAALTLQATPLQMGLLGILRYVPAILVSLVAGVWIDRLPRRPILIAESLGQALLLALIPVASLFHLLRIELLYGVTFLSGVLAVFGDVSFFAFLPLVVGPDSLAEGNARLSLSDSVTRIVGPGLGGWLVQLFTAPLALGADALSSLLGALVLAFLHTPETPSPHRQDRGSMWSDMRVGLRFLAAQPLLRAFLASTVSFDVCWNALYAVYFLYLVQTLRLPPTAIGAILGLGSGGALLGALLASRATARWGPGPASIGAQVLVCGGSVLIPLAMALPHLALPLLIAAEFVQSGAGTVFGITRSTLSQLVTPDHLRGRVRASTTFVGMSATVLGLLVGGVAGDGIGVSVIIVAGALGGLQAPLWLVLSPLRTLKQSGSAAASGNINC